jgi:hypothetical protein
MEKKNRQIAIKIKIYRNKINLKRRYILIEIKKYRRSILKALPQSRVKIYINRFLSLKDIKRVKILEVVGTKIRIDKDLSGAGWLYFPSHKLALGVVLLGKAGVVASAQIPARTAYFIPLNVPILQLLDVEVKDFF